MDSSSIGNGLIRVDGFVGLFTSEEISKEILYFWDTGRTTHEYNLMDHVLGDVGITEDLLHWGNALLEHADAQFLELGSGDGAVEVFILSQGINFDGSLGGRGEDTLGSFALGPEAADTPGVSTDIDSFLLEEVCATVLHKLVIKIFTSQVSVSGSSLDFEDTILNGEE